LSLLLHIFAFSTFPLLIIGKMSSMVETTALINKGITDAWNKPDDWSAHAMEYTQLLKNSPTLSRNTELLESIDALWPWSKANAIFDDGCGSGNVTLAMLGNYGNQIPETCKLVAADFSQGMIDQFENTKREKVATGDRHWKRVEAKVLDAQNLVGLENGIFSHALAGLMLFGLPDPLKALKELHRVLTSENGGGVVALSAWERIEWMEMLDLAKQVKPNITASLEIPKEWRSVEGIEGELKKAGFDHVECRRVETAMQLPPDLDRFLGLYCRSSNPMIAQWFKGMNEEDREQCTGKFKEHILSMHQERPIMLKGVVLVATARKGVAENTTSR